MKSSLPFAMVPAFRAAAMIVFIILLGPRSVIATDWSPQRAADYLDVRQKSWFAWPRAAALGGPCVSCHSGVPYLLARPVLRHLLGEVSPTPYETGLVDGLKARLEPGAKGMFKTTKEPGVTQAASIEAILAALFVGSDRAYERMWGLQRQGMWAWFDYKLEPWEASHSGFYGAVLAAVAASRQPAQQRRAAELAAHLNRSQAGQPLHDRLTLLWLAAKLPEAVPNKTREQIIKDALRQQQEDGGWTMELLGIFPANQGVLAVPGSSAYATALTAFTLQQGGVPRSDARMERALAWLNAHQDPEAGSWKAESLNKVHPAGSIEAEMMSEAATAFAVLALAGGETNASLAAGRR